MNTVLWIVQGLLAIMFIMAGIMKATMSKEKLLPKLPWVKDFSKHIVKTVGVFELLGGIGIVFPMLFGIYPFLTIIAAGGLGITMILAMVYHYSKKEMKEMVINFVFLLLCLFVVYGRY
jgi:uncharacterized membrane protein